MRFSSLPWIALAISVPWLAACSYDANIFNNSGGAAATASGGSGGETAQGGSGAGTSGTTTTDATTTTTTTTTTPPCGSDPNGDMDGDGFSPAQGDCNDCDPGVSPNAIDFPTAPGGEAKDEDCNGMVDDKLPACDTMFSLDDKDPANAARTIEICKMSAGANDWGMVSAAWVLSDGTPASPTDAFHLQHGIMPQFGTNLAPMEGGRLLVLSNGVARTPGQAGFADDGGAGTTSGAPTGYPKPGVKCNGMPLGGDPHDAIALDVVLRVPSNAKRMGFMQNFYAKDFPQFLCQQYDDTFFAQRVPPLNNMGDGQFGLGAAGEAVSLNAATYQACSCGGMTPCTFNGISYPCQTGDLTLIGTGFETHGSTTWMFHAVQVEPGEELTLRIGIYDGSDGIGEATSVVDAFRWLVD